MTSLAVASRPSRFSHPLVMGALVAALASCASPGSPEAPSPLPRPGPTTSADTAGPSLAATVAGQGTPEGVAGTVSVTRGRTAAEPLPLGDLKLGPRRGHWLVLHFAAGYCPTCNDVARDLDEIASLTRPQGVITIVVTPKDTSEWERHLSDVRVEEYGEAGRYAGETAVVDPQGRVRLLTSESPSPSRIAELTSSGAQREPVRVAVDAGAAVHPGDSGVIAVTFTTAPGHRVMSHEPSRPEYFALDVAFATKDGLKLEQPLYPPSQIALTAGDNVSVYAGKFVVRVPFTVAAAAAADRLELRGTVRYQACTDRVCLFPVIAHPKATVIIVPRPPAR